MKMKTNYLFLLGFALLASCGSQPTPSAPDATSTANVEIARKMFDAFNQHNWELMASYYSDSAVFLDPTLGIDYVHLTHQDIVGKYEELSKTIQNLQDDVKGIYPSGDKVAVEFVSTGTLPDSSALYLPIATVLTIKDGKIVKDATYYDN